MTSDELEKYYIPHLASQFSQGTPVLFTGAGFSAGATNIEGNNVPVGAELREEIWKLAFPGESFESDSSLRDLFEEARLRHAKAIKERFARLFSINHETLPEFYENFFSMPWSRCYTLNVDDLENAVAVKFELPRKINSYSAVTSNQSSFRQSCPPPGPMEQIRVIA